MRGDGDGSKRPRGCRATEMDELPATVLSSIFGLVSDVRSRNAMALVCREWHQLERCTRLSLSLRGNVYDLHMLPSSFSAVETLDMSNCSPWGYSAFQQQAGPELAAEWLRRAFPSVRHLCVYVRDTVDIAATTWTWPRLETLRLVRWHQRAMHPEEAAAAGMELCGLLSACPELVHLDLSRFYCWAEDVAPALQEPPGAGARLRRLDLLKLSPEGFKAADMAAIASACPSLEELQALCDFDPRFLDAVGDECLVHLASCCANLKLLHLVDTSQFEAGGQQQQAEADDEEADMGGQQQDEARVTSRGLEATFQLLPKLEDLALLLGHNVPDSAPAFEALAKQAVRIRCLQLGHFQGPCRRLQGRAGGLAACTGLETLFVKACNDLCDEDLETMAKGCPELSTLRLVGCPLITEAGLATAALLLQRTLACVHARGCRQLPTASVLRALSPVRAHLRQLHVDCCWAEDDKPPAPPDDDGWPSLCHLSLWAPAQLLLSSLPDLGKCPLLQEVSLRVEGDCRLSKRPGRGCEWGLRSLARFPALSTMRLDLSNVVGYALSAPAGCADISIWERFYLSGIQELRHLYKLDYSPPSDRDVNCRGIALPGAGLLSLCSSLRQLFVHGTAYEHLFMMLLKIPNLRDVQLREDYYPTPESESSTELRIDSCRRFESILTTRGSPD